MAELYIQFYNIKGSPNRFEDGPFSSVVCDGTGVLGVDEAEQETVIASYDHDLESFRVYKQTYPPFFFGYFEVVSK